MRLQMTTFRLGLFILLALAMFSAAVFLVGRQQTQFSANFRLQSEFETVAGLNEGAQVRVGGMHKGTVRSIILPKHPDGRIVVAMDLARDTQGIVRKDSVAAIQSRRRLKRSRSRRMVWLSPRPSARSVS